MAFRVLSAADAFWRPSNQMVVLNTDLAKQLGAATLGAGLAIGAEAGLDAPPAYASGRALRAARGPAASVSATIC
jgi:hypothetical protein